MENEPLALQKVNELRQTLPDDSELAEMVDTFATLLVLRQDVTNPMLGAKVTLYQKPPGEWVDIDYAEYREHHPNGGSLPDDPEDVYYENERTGRMTSGSDGPKSESPWWLRWRRVDGDRNKTLPDGEVEHRFTRYLQWDHEKPVEVDCADVPDEILSESGGAMNEVADARDREEWMIYGVGGDKRFKRRRLVPCEEYVGRRALVIEASIAEQPGDTTFWDPNREEYTSPDDYPMGTVNVVVPSDPWKVLGEDYVSDLTIETSVTPADGGTNGHVYTPGWDDVGAGTGE